MNSVLAPGDYKNTAHTKIHKVLFGSTNSVSRVVFQTLVFWPLFRAFVCIMAFLLINVALNIGEVFPIFIFILIFPDSDSVDASGRSILSMPLLLRSSSARTTILVLLGLCRRGLGPI